MRYEIEQTIIRLNELRFGPYWTEAIRLERMMTMGTAAEAAIAIDRARTLLAGPARRLRVY